MVEELSEKHDQTPLLPQIKLGFNEMGRKAIDIPTQTRKQLNESKRISKEYGGSERSIQ